MSVWVGGWVRERERERNIFHCQIMFFLYLSECEVQMVDKSDFWCNTKKIMPFNCDYVCMLMHRPCVYIMFPDGQSFMFVLRTHS